jgi:1-deoxy-D-xylulose-5-phosphate reductoisomerase
LNTPLKDLPTMLPSDAIAHPIWSMGQKISVDSATLMNKGLEVIEACYLYDVPENKIEVLIHQEALVHGLIHYQDGSMIAQLSTPDMTIPIAHALSPVDMLKTTLPRLDLHNLNNLTFTKVCPHRFPALNLARTAYMNGPSSMITLNAANEIAVEAFLNNHIHFTSIIPLIIETMEKFSDTMVGTLETVLDIDTAVRGVAATLVPRHTAIAS